MEYVQQVLILTANKEQINKKKELVKIKSFKNLSEWF